MSITCCAAMSAIVRVAPCETPATCGEAIRVEGLPQQVIRLRRLLRKAVEPRAAEMPEMQGRAEIGLIDQAAARRYSPECSPASSALQLRGTDHLAGFLGQRTVQTDDVGLSQKIIERPGDGRISQASIAALPCGSWAMIRNPSAAAGFAASCPIDPNQPDQTHCLECPGR